jgi:hypothetical protein
VYFMKNIFYILGVVPMQRTRKKCSALNHLDAARRVVASIFFIVCKFIVTIFYCDASPI